MTQSQEHELHILNELIVATLESVGGYRKIASAIEDRYAPVFTQHASVRQYVAEQLEDEVRNLGGKPAHQRSILAVAHRVALDAEESDQETLRDTIERNEKKLTRQFEAALQSEGLSERNQDLVHKGYRLVKAGRDQAWELLKHHLVRH